MVPVDDHPWTYQVEPQSPVPIIGAHCAAPFEIPIMVSPAPQVSVTVPVAPPPVEKLIPVRCPVVIVPVAIWIPEMVYGWMLLPLIRSLTIYPSASVLSTPPVGPPNAAGSTQIPVELSITLLSPCGEPSVVMRSSLMVCITLSIDDCICRSACVIDHRRPVKPTSASTTMTPFMKG